MLGERVVLQSEVIRAIFLDDSTRRRAAGEGGNHAPYNRSASDPIISSVMMQRFG